MDIVDLETFRDKTSNGQLGTRPTDFTPALRQKHLRCSLTSPLNPAPWITTRKVLPLAYARVKWCPRNRSAQATGTPCRRRSVAADLAA